MNDVEYHHSGLDDTEAMEKGQGGSHGERGQNVHDEDYRVESLQMGLKHLVLEPAT